MEVNMEKSIVISVNDRRGGLLNSRCSVAPLHMQINDFNKFLRHVAVKYFGNGFSGLNLFLVPRVKVESWVKQRDDSMTKVGSQKDGEDERLRVARKVAEKTTSRLTVTCRQRGHSSHSACPKTH